MRAGRLLLLVVLWPALSGFDLFLRRDPNLEEGNRALADGKAEAALQAYDRAASELPDEPIVRFDRGTALYALGKYPEAQKEFQRAAEAHDAGLKADAYYNMGNSLYQEERFKEALDAYKHTLGLRSDDRRAKWNLELALRQLQQQQQKQQQKQQQAQQKSAEQKPQDQGQGHEAPGTPPPKQDEQQANGSANAPQPSETDQQAKSGEGKEPADKKDNEKNGTKDTVTKKDEKENKDNKAKNGAAGHEAREIDRQDAEAVLDALERVEPTVQKDLARRRAGDRRPTRDW